MKQVVRYFVWGLLIACLSSGLAHARPPSLPKQGLSLKHLVPSGWKVLKFAYGDLNRDGRKDLVFVIQGTDPKKITDNKEGLGDDTLDLNPRILAIYFRDKRTGRYYKKRQMNNFIPLKDTPTMDEPLDGLSISGKGIFQLGFRYWYSAGSWEMSTYSYSFRYRKGRFGLVGYDNSYTHRASGETSETSINFLSRRMVVKKGNIAKDDWISVRRKKFRLRRLKTLKSFKKLFAWTFRGVSI